LCGGFVHSEKLLGI